MALIEYGVAVFYSAGEIRVIRVLAGNIGIDRVECMGPGIASQHRQAVTEAVSEVHIQRVVIGVAVVHIALNQRIRRLWIGGGRGVARQAALAVPRDPIWASAISGLCRTDLPWRGADKRRRGVHI